MEGFIATPKWCLVCPNGWRLHAQRDVETGRWEGEFGSASEDKKDDEDNMPQPPSVQGLKRMFPWAYVRARYRSGVPGFSKGGLGAKCQPGAKSHAHEVAPSGSRIYPTLTAPSPPETRATSHEDGDNP